MSKNRVLKPFLSHNHAHGRCISEALTTAQNECDKRGLRFTELRKRVLEIVWHSHQPIKAYDILERLRQQQLGAAAPPTVYRALDFLLEQGLVHKIESLNAYVGCGAPETKHDSQFLICRNCGVVAELDNAEVSRLLAIEADAIGFQIAHETIEIEGCCHACRQVVA